MLFRSTPVAGKGAYLRLSHQERGAVGKVIDMPTNPANYATQLYGVLHQLDAHNFALEGLASLK